MSNKSLYLSLTDLHTQLPVFFQPWWLDIVSADWDIALVEKDHKILALFPYQMEKKLGVKILRNPLLTPYLGPHFFYPPQLSGAKKINWEEQVFEQLWQQIPAWDSFDIQCSTAFDNYLLFHHKGFSNSNLLTYHLDLLIQKDLLFSAIQSSHRKRIEQASALYHIDEGEQYTNVLLDLHKKTFLRKDKKYVYPPQLLSRLIQKSYQLGLGKLLVAKDSSGGVIGAIFTVQDQHSSYLLLSAVDVDRSHKGTVCLLIWQSIIAAQNNGLKVFDFEGSMDEGIEGFFRRFGGTRRNYLRFEQHTSKIWKFKKILWG